MKKKNLLIIATIVILAIVILIAIYWSTRDQQGNNPEDIDNSVKTSEEMVSSENTGTVHGSQARRSLDVYLEEQDAAIDFLTGMIPHHESAMNLDMIALPPTWKLSVEKLLIPSPILLGINLAFF